IGLKEGLVEEGIAQAFDAPLDLAKSTNLLLGNIGQTAVLARRGELKSATLVPFRPGKFMLPSPQPPAGAILERAHHWFSSGGPAKVPEHPLPLGPIQSPPTIWLEDKYDGIRCQLHKVGKRVALYSRDLKEITGTFIEIADAARKTAHDFVVDG